MSLVRVSYGAITLCLSTNEIIRTPSSQQEFMDASKFLITLLIHWFTDKHVFSQTVSC